MQYLHYDLIIQAATLMAVFLNYILKLPYFMVTPTIAKRNKQINLSAQY